MRQHFFMVSLRLIKADFISTDLHQLIRFVTGSKSLPTGEISVTFAPTDGCIFASTCLLELHLPTSFPTSLQKQSICRSNYSCDRKWWQVFQQHLISSSWCSHCSNLKPYFIWGKGIINKQEYFHRYLWQLNFYPFKPWYTILNEIL